MLILHFIKIIFYIIFIRLLVNILNAQYHFQHGNVMIRSKISTTALA